MKNIGELMEMMGSAATMAEAERMAELLARRGIYTTEDASEMEDADFFALVQRVASEKPYVVYHEVGGKARANVIEVMATSEADAIAQAEQDSTPNNDFRLNGQTDGLGRLHEYLPVEQEGQ